MKKVKKAIIPAAGYGTRSLPITKVIPKEMFPIQNKPAIQYIVEEAVAAGIEEILFVVSRNKNMIIDYFDRSLELEKFLETKDKLGVLDKTELPDVHIQFVRQPYANGLGAAIALGKRFANDEPVAILLPDEIIIGKETPALAQLIAHYQKYDSTCVGVMEVPEEHLHLYGVMNGVQIGNDLFKVNDFIEKPKVSPPSKYAVIGRYVVAPNIFDYLVKIPAGVGNEIQLTDALKKLASLQDCYGLCIAGDRFDIGKEEDYHALISYFMNKKKGE